MTQWLTKYKSFLNLKGKNGTHKQYS